MSDYTTSYAIAYQTPSIQQQIEVAVVTAAGQIQNEDPATANHVNRLAWADWAIGSSSVAWVAFRWPVANNPSIRAACVTDPSGQSVLDSDVQFVVNANLQQVVNEWVTSNTKAPTV